MKVLFWAGLVILILGILSLFVPLPQRERHGVEMGDVQIGVETKTENTVSPWISAVLIAGGAGMMIAGGRTRAR